MKVPFFRRKKSFLLIFWLVAINFLQLLFSICFNELEGSYMRISEREENVRILEGLSCLVNG